MLEAIEKRIPFEIQVKRLLLCGVIWALFELLIAPLIGDLISPLGIFIVPFIVVTLLLIVKTYLLTPGTLMLAAVVAATLKFLIGEIVLTGTFMVILLEAAIVELTFLLFNYRPIAFFTSGVLVEGYNLIHPLLTLGVFYQSQQFIIFRRWLANLFGYDYTLNLSNETALLILIVLHSLFGLLAGWLALKGFAALSQKQSSSVSTARAN